MPGLHSAVVLLVEVLIVSEFCIQCEKHVKGLNDGFLIREIVHRDIAHSADQSCIVARIDIDLA